MWGQGWLLRSMMVLHVVRHSSQLMKSQSRERRKNKTHFVDRFCFFPHGPTREAANPLSEWAWYDRSHTCPSSVSCPWEEKRVTFPSLVYARKMEEEEEDLLLFHTRECRRWQKKTKIKTWRDWQLSCTFPSSQTGFLALINKLQSHCIRYF